jgi:voltage-dependent anion channel protein 2
MAPVVFKDVQKSAKDLLKDDYCFDKKFKLSTKTQNGVAFTAEGTMNPKGTEGKVTSKFKYDTISVDKLFTGSNGRFGLEASTKDNLVEGLKLGLKFEDGVAGSGAGAGSVNATYTTDNVTVTSEIDVVEGPTLYSGVTVAYQGFVAGADIKYNTQLDDKEATPSLTDAGAVVGYGTTDFSTSVHAQEKGKKLNFVYHQVVDADTAVVAQLELEPKGSNRLLTLGGAKRIDAFTTFSGKVDSKGVVSANWIQVIRPQVKVIVSAAVDSKSLAADSHKFGIQLLLG